MIKVCEVLENKTDNISRYITTLIVYQLFAVGQEGE